MKAIIYKYKSLGHRNVFYHGASQFAVENYIRSMPSVAIYLQNIFDRHFTIDVRKEVKNLRRIKRKKRSKP